MTPLTSAPFLPGDRLELLEPGATSGLQATVLTSAERFPNQWLLSLAFDEGGEVGIVFDEEFA